MRKVNQLLWASLLLGALASCTSNGSGTVVGSDPATSFAISSAFVTGGASGVFLSSGANACNTKGALVPDSKLLAIACIVAPGTFAIESAEFQALDSHCGLITALQTTTGSITFTSIDPMGTGNVTTAEGTFDITFGSEHMTGSFTTGSCSVVNTSTDSSVICL